MSILYPTHSIWFHWCEHLREATVRLVQLVLFKTLGYARTVPDASGATIVIANWFPTCWEKSEFGVRERFFGTWPEFLAKRGFKYFFAVIYSGRTL